MKEAPTTETASCLPSDRPGHGSGTRDLPQGWVSRGSRRLEPWVLGAIAVCLTALAVFAQADLVSAATAALLPLLGAAWALATPALRQRELALRAFAMLTGALLMSLQGGPGFDAPEALRQLWLTLVVVGYALLLRPGWLLGLAAFALLQWIGVGLLAGSAAVGDATAGLLLPVSLGMGAALAGARMRRLDTRREAHCIDPATRLCTLPGLLAYGEDLLAARSHPNATLAVFDCRDLLEVRRIYGNRIARTLVVRMAGKLAAIAGDHGLAARTGPAEFAVLLPGMDRERALRALQQVLGTPSRIEYEAGDSEIVLVPEFLLGRMGEDEDDLAGLHRLLSRKLASAREHEAQRRRYLRRERERHSRPMSIPDEIPAPAQSRRERLRAAPAARPEIPPTLPLPLPAR